MTSNENVKSSYIEPVHLMSLKGITDKTVSQDRLNSGEAESILEKAGLIKVSDKEWKDEQGATYTFGNE